MSLPTAKQNLRRIIVGLFPWLPGFVSITSAKGKGLAIRAASGLLHLAGGPGDPAVHRVGDAGTAGTWTAAGNTLTLTAADGSQVAFAFVPSTGTLTITPTPVPPATMPFDQKTRAQTGSEKVTCA